MKGPSFTVVALIVIIQALLSIQALGQTAQPSLRCGLSADKPREGVLALSGGGYRALLFHVGSLWRLNELGCLSTLSKISSVSGGSIASGILATHWAELSYDERGVAANFENVVAVAAMRFAAQTIDYQSFWKGLLPGTSAAIQLVDRYNEELFSRKTLGDLPPEPQFVFNATNLQTGKLWIFSKSRIGDPFVGYASFPSLEIATVVAASSAYPPVLSPLEIVLPRARWSDVEFNWLERNIDREPYRKKVVLTDGGIIDNLGLEAVWAEKGTIFVSDGGGGLSFEPDPSRDVVRQTRRVIDLIHGQHDVLRTRILLEKFRERKPDGVYWSIHQAYTHCDVQAQDVVEEDILQLGGIPTRLKAIDRTTQERLVNWGYLSVDRALPYLNRLWRGPTWEYTSNKVPFPESALKLVPYSPTKRGC